MSTHAAAWTTMGLALGAATAPMAAAAADTQAPRPNVILILADDMGYETVGAYGGTSYQTPRLDELAAAGMRFDQAHALPLCTPSRVQLMSGRYNSRNYTGFGEMDRSIHTIGNLMHDAGYATFIGGKWQLGGGFDAPHHFGFDEYCLWQLTRDGQRRANRYPNPGLEINGEEVNFQLGEYGPDVVNDYVLDFIDRHQDEPFFVYYPMILPHWPFEPTPASDDWDPQARRGDLREREGKGDPKYFADMVAYADGQVGKVVDKLEELGLRDNTLILFVGDNGTAPDIVSQTTHGPVTGGKRRSTDNGTHVPLIANWPGTVPAGATNDDLICFTYFYPTLAELAGVDLPDDRPVDGQSLVPVLRGEESELRDWLYVWWWAYNRPNGPGGEFARTHRYKLYHNGRFFDLLHDPGEQHRLAQEQLTDEQRAVRDRLRKIMQANERPGFRN